MEHLMSAFWAAAGLLIQTAVRGAVLWLVFKGSRTFITDYLEKWKPIKLVLIFVPVSMLIAAFFAFWVYTIEPKEKAIYHAQMFFFLVLLPLWAGCIWGMIQKQKKTLKGE